MKKKVLLVVPSLNIGGQERIAVNTAIGLQEHFDVKIAIFQKQNTDQYEAPCSVINLNVPTKKGTFGKLTNQLLRGIKLCLLRNKEKFDYVISFGNTANLSNVISGICGCGKTISGIHGFAEVKKGIILSIIIRLSDKVICITHAMQAGLLKLYPECNKSVVIENGYILWDTERLSPTHDSDGEKIIFVSLGRFEHVKGFDLLVRAFQIVLKSLPTAELWLIGDGSQRQSIEKDIEELGITEKVKLWGYQKDPQMIMKDASIYVLPSRNEGLSNAIIEALNVKLPVLAVDCECGPRELLTGFHEKKDGFAIEYAKNGVLVENYDNEDRRIEQLAKAMIDLSRDEAYQEKLRSRAFLRAQDYSLDVYIRKLARLFESLE